VADLWTVVEEETITGEDVIVEIPEDQPFAEADPVHVTAVALLIADRAVIEMTPLPEQIVLHLRSE